MSAAATPRAVWGRSVRAGAAFAVPLVVAVAALVVSLDVLQGQAAGAALRSALPLLALLALAVFVLVTGVFAFVFSHATRTARRFAGEGVAMYSAATLEAGRKQDGALVLTERRLVFVPYGLRSRSEPVEVPLANIREVYAGAPVRGGYGAIAVYLRGGDALPLKVWDVARWSVAFDAAGLRRADG